MDLTGNATLNVDFSEGHTLERTPVPTPAEPGLGTVSAGVLTPRGLLYLYRTRSRDGAMVIATLPLALRRPDDHRRVALRWQEASEAAAVRTYLTIAIGDGPFDLTIGAPWDAPAAALQIQPYLRTVHPVMVSGAEPATVRLGASGSSPDGLTAIAWSVELSPAWLTGTGASSYAAGPLEGTRLVDRLRVSSPRRGAMGDDAGRARIHAGADADGGQDRVRGGVLRRRHRQRTGGV